MNRDEDRTMVVRNIISTLGEKVIAFPPAYARITGSVNAGLMLAQSVYWIGTLPEDHDGFFYKTQQQWQEELFLTRREQESARKRLKAIEHNGSPLWMEDLRGNPAKLYFSVDLYVLGQLLGTNKYGGKRHASLAESATQVRRKAPHSHTENTTESKSETIPGPPIGEPSLQHVQTESTEETGPGPAQEQPFQMLERVMAVQGVGMDVWTRQQLGRQLSVAKRLIADGVTIAEVESCCRWIVGQNWASSVDMFLIEKKLGDHRIATQRKSNQHPGTTRRGMSAEQALGKYYRKESK